MSQDYTDVNATNLVGQLGSFDIVLAAGNYSVTVNGAGQDYGADQTFTILGTDLFGTSPTNDATITITSVNASKWNHRSKYSGTANTGSASTLGVTGFKQTTQGVGATFSVTRSNPTDSSTTYLEVIGSATGSNYAVGDRITLQGQSLGGSPPANDITVTVPRC